MDTANPLKPGLASDTTKSAKNLAQTIAKKIAQEPWEILKQAGGQLAGMEQAQGQKMQGEQGVNDNSFEENRELVSQRDKVRSQRLMQALQTELDEIKKKRQQEKLQKQQEEEMVKKEEQQVKPALVEPAAKKGRRLFNFGKKTQMQRQQTQTERPLPPSG